jgi:hypothetical protein
VEPIEVSPNLTCNVISIELLPRIMDTNIVYIGEDTFNSNTTKKDDTPKKTNLKQLQCMLEGSESKGINCQKFCLFSS